MYLHGFKKTWQRSYKVASFNTGDTYTLHYINCITVLSQRLSFLSRSCCKAFSTQALNLFFSKLEPKSDQRAWQRLVRSLPWGISEVIFPSTKKLSKIAQIPKVRQRKSAPFRKIVISDVKCTAMFIITDAKNHFATLERREQWRHRDGSFPSGPLMGLSWWNPLARLVQTFSLILQCFLISPSASRADQGNSH